MPAGPDPQTLAQEQAKRLPIVRVKAPLLQQIKQHGICIVLGETGSGKSTQIPQVNVFSYEFLKIRGVAACALYALQIAYVSVAIVILNSGAMAIYLHLRAGVFVTDRAINI